MLVELPFPIFYPNPRVYNPSTGVTLDAAGEYTAWVINAPEDFTIDKVHVLCVSATGSPVVDVRIETVDANGIPTGTLWAANTNASLNATAVAWHAVSLTADAVISKGDRFAVVIAYTSGTSVNFRRQQSSDGWGVGNFCYGYSMTYLSSTVSVTSPGQLVLGLQDASGAYADWGFEIGSASIGASYAVHTLATFDEVGVKFVAPFDMRCIGASFVAWSIASTTNCTWKLYDSNDNLLASKATLGGTANGRDLHGGYWITHQWDGDPVDLVAGNTYRLTCLGLVDTAAFDVVYHALADSDQKAITPWGTNGVITKRDAGGSWTDENLQEPGVLLVLSHIGVSANPVQSRVVK